VSLPQPLAALLEQLAVNVHEAWQRTRLEQGWKHGPERSDRLKTHPSLVPYAELSEEEKEFDRRTAAETLKTLLALGYSLEKR
jgi:ryanodine receptor 3